MEDRMTKPLEVEVLFPARWGNEVHRTLRFLLREGSRPGALLLPLRLHLGRRVRAVRAVLELEKLYKGVICWVGDDVLDYRSRQEEIAKALRKEKGD